MAAVIIPVGVVAGMILGIQAIMAMVTVTVGEAAGITLGTVPGITLGIQATMVMAMVAVIIRFMPVEA